MSLKTKRIDQSISFCLYYQEITRKLLYGNYTIVLHCAGEHPKYVAYSRGVPKVKSVLARRSKIQKRTRAADRVDGLVKVKAYMPWCTLIKSLEDRLELDDNLSMDVRVVLKMTVYGHLDHCPCCAKLVYIPFS